MDPKFQTSFIPKAPISTQSKALPISIPTINIFSTISAVVFFLTVILLGGTFGYEMFLNNQISQIESEIISANQSYQISDAQNLINANSRIVSIKKLLDQHVVISELFSLLQNLTLKRISFSGFIYDNRNGEQNISMDTESQTYNALAMQLKLFEESGFIKNSKFSDLNLAENGNIKTKFTANIDPKLISFKNIIESSSPNQ